MYIWGCLLLILLPILLHAELSTERCGQPGQELVGHGRTGEAVERYLEIVCEMPGETRYLRCDDNNQWTRFNDATCSIPTCDLSKLPRQEADVVRVEPARNQLGDVVSFRCLSGLQGEPIYFKCKKKTTNGGNIKFHWKPQNRTGSTRLKKPNCTVPDLESCQYHPTPHRVILDQYLTHKGLHLIVEDDELTLGCTEGYKLNGDSFVYCDIGGVWNPEVLPTCEKVQCTVPNTPHLRARLDGIVTPLTPGANLTTNQKVAWQCEEGYTLRSSNGAALLTCDADWQREIPSCQAVRCPHIDRPEHGNHVLHNNHGVRCVGSWIEAECDSGYTLYGTRRRFCMTAGSWNGTLQVCDNGGSTCKNPGRPIGGRKVGYRYNRGDKVRFSCNRGHTLLGSMERECLDNGEWTGEETRCIAANEYMTKEEALMRLENGIAKISEKSTDTKLQKDKLRNLMGKKVLLGKNKMETMNPNQRSTIQELRDNGGLDVYFVLDTSGSIPMDHKNTSVEIIKKLVKLVGVSPRRSGTGFGFLAFDSEVWRRVAVAEKTDPNAIINFLDGFKQTMFERPTGGTAPATAFVELRTLIQTRIFTDMESMQNRSSAIVLLSDGIKNEGGDPVKIRNLLINQAKLLNHEIHVYCIGVGSVNLPLLSALATNGSDYLVYLQSLSELEEVVGKVYNGDTKYGECGIQGHPELYTGNISDVDAASGTWRWVGGLYWYDTDGIPPSKMEDQLSDSKFQCGVSLLTEGPRRTQSEWVLTAAHCVYVQGELIDASKLLIKFGSISSSTALKEAMVVGVDRVFPHENFLSDTLLNDVALLKLKEHLPFDYDIRPVCLHKPNGVHIKVNTMAKMTGWGKLAFEDQNISPTLKQLSARIQSNGSCTHSASSIKGQFRYPKNFCAGNVQVGNRLLDACTFDSGSPLVVCEKDNLKKVCTQIGLVSFGDGCGKAGKFGVYTNTTTYYNWIMNKMNAN